MCTAVWRDRMNFIRDKSLEMNGYQANFNRLELGLFYFTHKVEGCYSTLVVEAKDFYDLNPGIQYSEKKNLTETCPRYCHTKENLEKCEAECECVFVRDLIHILQTIKHDGDEQHGSAPRLAI